MLNSNIQAYAKINIIVLTFLTVTVFVICVYSLCFFFAKNSIANTRLDIYQSV